jgi:hypothetical protein
MWMFISRINLRTTRQILTRFVVTAAVVVGTGTQVAMALLPNPVSSGASTNHSVVSDSPAFDSTTRQATARACGAV